MKYHQAIDKIESIYRRIAKEEIEVEAICACVYVFGSELATLRIFRYTPTVRQGYSEGREKFYVCFEDIIDE